METSVIYCIFSKIDGKRYIGQSRCIKKRIQDHFSAMRNGKHCNRHLQSSVLKYGISNFEYQILEYANPDVLDDKEREWINKYHSDQMEYGYNLENGGRVNKQHCAETRLKISASSKGKIISPETRAKISAHRKKTKDSEITKIRKSITLKAVWAKKLIGFKYKEKPVKRKFGSLEYRLHQAQKSSGRKMPKKAIAKRIETQRKKAELRGYFYSPETIEKMRNSRNAFLKRTSQQMVLPI